MTTLDIIIASIVISVAITLMITTIIVYSIVKKLNAKIDYQNHKIGLLNKNLYELTLQFNKHITR